MDGLTPPGPNLPIFDDLRLEAATTTRVARLVFSLAPGIRTVVVRTVPCAVFIRNRAALFKSHPSRNFCAEIGLQKGLQESILEALEIRFSQVPGGLRDAVEAICDESRLRNLHKTSIQAATIEDFTRCL